VNSTTYAKSDALEQQMGIHARFFALRGKTPESVIQDVDIPIARAPEFLAFFLEKSESCRSGSAPSAATTIRRKFPLYCRSIPRSCT